MNYIYSAINNSFYPSSMKDDYQRAGTWPDDAVEVDDNIYLEFTAEPPEGKMRIAGENGLPVWGDLTPPTREEMIKVAEQQQQQLIDSAMQSVTVIQLKLQAGRILTDSEKAKLNAILDYIDAVTAANTTNAPDIDWPTLPAELAN
ncbi:MULTISPECIES: tail fiber assembly protein [Enterobacterales]|uniref:tail fiber assembly protein n=1 Tax=Enterobacterales TaxID=91347 RepID=UPI0017874105|nr:tail fiber assembly protein [Erwinia persicina]MBD8165727.1 tail fiber assembly protein [Erwinia persicina]HBN0282810.1 tail fiber assembly protein [Escherichia coli]HBN5174224.1 tail fiber assembly protein [Escherichia coli]